MDNSPRISLVLPILDGERYIERSICELGRLEEIYQNRIEFILVDDGSTDNTLTIAKRLTSDSTNWRLIQNVQNMGKGYSVRKGMLTAGGDVLVFVDADLSYPVDSIRQVIESVSTLQPVVIVSRVGKGAVLEVPSEMFGYFYTRHSMSRLLNLLVRAMIVNGVTDTQSGLKGFTKESALNIFARQTLDRFSFDIEILFIAKRLNYKLLEISVRSRYFSEPTTVHFLRDGINVICSLLKIRWNSLIGEYSKSLPKIGRLE